MAIELKKNKLTLSGHCAVEDAEDLLNALIKIGLSGQPSIDKVAGPVGEALIMTALGLVVAVPAVFAYNILLKRNKAIQDIMREFTGDLEANLIGGVKPEVHGVRPAAPAAAVKK